MRNRNFRPTTRFIYLEMIQYRATVIVSSMWSIEWHHFQWPWTTLNQDFKVMPLFDAKYLRNGTRYRHRYSGILIGTYTCPPQGRHFKWPWYYIYLYSNSIISIFKWPWVTVSDIVKYSTAESIARFLCDSWASCFPNVEFFPYVR